MGIYCRNTFLLFLTLLGIASFESRTFAAEVSSKDQLKELREASVQILHKALAEETEWIKVHAAEALVFNNYPKDVRPTFEIELEKDPPAKYRIGVWRVMVKAAGNDMEIRQKYLNKIIAVFENPASPDRSTAAETLAKLGYSEASSEIVAASKQQEGRLAAYASWVLANSGKPESETSLARFLDSEDPDARAVAGYAIRHLARISPETLTKLRQAADKEPLLDNNWGRVYMLSALYIHSEADDYKAQKDYAKTELLKYVQTGVKLEKNELCCALAEAGDMSDLSTLKVLLEDSESDVRVYAANAVLRIARRDFRGLQWPDWTIICLYGAAMLGLGAYYSRRQTNAEEYFLGSRNMNPYIVGISMFATLLSTISYLGTPGEMIKHGPIVVFMFLGIPITYLVVGYILVPHIMKLRITSAYEILEARLGLPVRLLGSIIFIITRLVWMGLLVYLAAKVLVTMLNWHEDMIPWVVIGAGVVAVVYTAMGGLRAVIVTDVFQFVILFVGAIVTIILISVAMGGFSWFPTQWAPHWDVQPLFSWNISTRATLIGAILSYTFWWICTAGSDQVAIQRYLATRDIKTARRAFLINATAEVSIGMTLYLVGFALLGFFLANPHLIPDGKNLIADADFLFPRYVANYLPIGLAGLVVAGMLAAAMSSLDSGINSIVTVTSRDFIDRFRRKKNSEGNNSATNLRLAKYMVLIIGILVILVSSQMKKVPGNIMEITMKTNGLFVGPLFGLFFMAFFVRRATILGTFIGAIYGFMTAFIFAYWDKITGAANSLSFQLILPAAVIVNIFVGILLSRISTRDKSIIYIVGCGIISLAPLVAIYVALLKWGIEVANYMEWGVAIN